VSLDNPEKPPLIARSKTHREVLEAKIAAAEEDADEDEEEEEEEGEEGEEGEEEAEEEDE
jgi:hypothetical protein